MSEDTDVTKDLVDNIPRGLNNVELGAEKGLLSPIGDPLGQVLNNVLSPVGNLVGGVGDRMGLGFLNPANQEEQGDNAAKGGEEEYEKLGGKDQTGQNPLGL